MKKALISVSLIALLLVAGCLGEGKSGTDTVKAEVLVDPAWVQSHLDDPGVRIIDLSSSPAVYENGHIKGAVYVDWRSDIADPEQVDRYNIAPREQIEALLGRLGVDEDTTIVLYDNLDNRLSTRTYWTLKVYGHEDVRILDGGRRAWEAAGGEYTAEAPEITATDYRAKGVNSEIKTDMGFILDNLDNPDVVLIDGRPSEMYTGEKAGVVFNTKAEHKRRGHIPGALNIPWKENLNEDGTFKSPEELKSLYESHGVTPDKTVVTYCNEGLHASPPWFVLSELLGYPDVRLYDDSMAEWANRDDTPMNTGPDP
ncbi:MAG: sulfurtransferase [Methanobacteriota archaeon]|nr:MAG: sulfurtransferase [Euryarchaeota archaeon]